MGESIYRVKDKTAGFFIVMNECFRRDDLSARAKGIFAYLMTLPDEWIIHKSEVFEHFTEGRDALDTAFKELIKVGYVKMDIEKDKGKFSQFTYTVFETCQSEGKPVPGKPVPGKPFPENPQLLITDILITDKKNLASKPKDSVSTPSGEWEKVEKAYFSEYGRLHKKGQMKTEEPELYDFARSRSAIRGVLKKISLPRVVGAIEAAARDAWVVKGGFILTTILSSAVLARLLPKVQDYGPLSTIDDTHDWTEDLVDREAAARGVKHEKV